jgi:DNA-binding transcriptional MerR regulator
LKKKQFIKKEVAEILGIRPSQVQYYTEQGIITPDISAPKGRGTRRVYSQRNLIELLIAKRAVEHGISIENAAKIIAQLRLLDEGRDPYDEDLYALSEKANWSIESWRDMGQASVFLYYEQRYDFQELIHLYFCGKDKTDSKKDLFKIEISHDTKSLYFINLTDLVDGIGSGLESS